MGAEEILMRALMPKQHLQEHQGVRFFQSRVIIQCLFPPPTNWQEQKVLPPLPTSCITLRGNPLTLAQKVHRLHAWIWLDSSPDGQVGLKKPRCLFLLLPRRLNGCWTREGFQDHVILPSASGKNGSEALPAPSQNLSWLTHALMYSVARTGTRSGYQPIEK